MFIQSLSYLLSLNIKVHIEFTHFTMNSLYYIFLFFALSYSSSSSSSESSVKLSVYYESLCPDSINFISSQFFPAWKRFGSQTLNVDLHPFGNANVSN